MSVKKREDYQIVGSFSDKKNVSSNPFIDDLIRLGQIKNELQTSILSNKFL